MTDRVPAVSVVIPTYQCARFIRDAVESVLAQAGVTVEIIVVDDGSTDETREVLARYENRVRYLHQENAGSSRARNRGLAAARGALVWFLDADDLLLPATLADHAAFFAAHPDIGVAPSGWWTVTEDGVPIRELRPWRDHPVLDAKSWLLFNPGLFGATLFRRTWLARVDGPFDESLRRSEDTDLFLRLALAGCPMAWFERTTLAYRQRAASLTRDAALTESFAETGLDKLFATPDLPANLRALEGHARFNRLLWVAWSLRRSGDPAKVAGYLRRSLAISPDDAATTVRRWGHALAAMDPEPLTGDERRVLVAAMRLAAPPPLAADAGAGLEPSSRGLTHLVRRAARAFAREPETEPREAPAVDVVIPAYNAAAFLPQAIESALAATTVRPTVIVVDDGSTDDTAAAVAPYLDRIRYVRQPRQGQSAARNHGIALGRGDFVAFMDADDHYLPGGLSALRDALATRPDLGALQGGIVEADASGRHVRDLALWDDCADFDVESCVRRKPVALKSMILRREWAERIEGFDPELRWAEDVDFLIRLVAAGCRVEWLRRSVTCYRLHTGNITRDAIGEAAAVEVVLDKYFARPDVPSTLRRDEGLIRFYARTWGAWRMFRTGQRDAIATQLRRALAASPKPIVATALEWQRLFHEWTQRERRDATDVHDVSGYLEAALAEHAGSRAAWTQLRFWVRVWEPLLQNDLVRARDGLTALSSADREDVIRLAQTSVLATDALEMLDGVERFRSECTRGGLVSARMHGDVTGLYLTVFGQALLAGRPRIALRALGAAIRSTTSPRATLAWVSFARAALLHWSGRPAALETRSEG